MRFSSHSPVADGGVEWPTPPSTAFVTDRDDADGRAVPGPRPAGDDADGRVGYHVHG